jgi:hypothetical protein
MLIQADRAAERQRVKLEEFQRPAQEGSLRVLKMTSEECWRYPTVPAKARRK